jgi:hypothetical protein
MKQVMTLAVGMMMLMMTGGCHIVTDTPPTSAEQADNLARAVMAASGANTWSRVSTVGFTFVVRDGGDVKVSRNHLWNVKAGTDTVSVGDKSTTVEIDKPNMGDPVQVEAFKAWTNDSYWLLAPLKLFDMGVTREYFGRQEVMGKSYEVLRLSFKGVGMTPGDRYNLYIDPYTSLVAWWDYMPTEDKTMRASWEQYRHMSGLKLATFHQMGSKTITMEKLSVASE